MNGILRHSGLRNTGWLAALLFTAVSVRANPIAVGGGSTFTFGTIFTIFIAILVEAVCISLLLHRSRTPRLFVLWIMGMHLLTYPIFIGIVWLSVGLRPELAVGFGEGMIVLIEGGVVYYLCRLAPSAKKTLPPPTVGKVLLASLLGNICSAVAYPLLTFLNAWIAHFFHSSGME